MEQDLAGGCSQKLCLKSHVAEPYQRGLGDPGATPLPFMSLVSPFGDDYEQLGLLCCGLGAKGGRSQLSMENPLTAAAV